MPRLVTLVAALILATPAGAQAPLMPVSAAPQLDARAERLVATWAEGDAGPTVAVFSDAFRAAAAVTVPRLVRTLARHHGPLTAVAAETTTQRPDGRIDTVVAVAYARRVVRLRLTWNADETLRTIALAPSAAPLVAVR